MTILFELRDVGLTLGNRHVLEAVSLTVRPTEVIGLIGQNGSGKSSLLKVMARQQPSSAGDVRFAGCPLTKWKDRAFARRVAYLPQDPPCDTGLLVKELVALGRYPWHGALGRFGEADRAAVADACR